MGLAHGPISFTSRVIAVTEVVSKLGICKQAQVRLYFFVFPESIISPKTPNFNHPVSQRLSVLLYHTNHGKDQTQREKSNALRATSSPPSNVACAKLQASASSSLSPARIPKHGTVFLPLQHRFSIHERRPRSREPYARLMV